VVSISLGGPWPSSSLRRAIAHAVDAGMIVLAAAGNEVKVVVFPAAFEEAIAVAGTTIKDAPWSGSSRGDAVDISAPGASVWRAIVKRAGNGGFAFDVTRGSGTSFAVATTAGVAALWLSFHGWTTLERKYGAANIARVFKSLLQQTCRTPRGWDTRNYGPGIVDAERLLRASLPAAAPARKLRDPRRAAVATDRTGLETIVHLMPEASRTEIEAAVAGILGIDDRTLPHAMQDVGEELAFQLVMNPPLMAHMQARARRRSITTRAAGAGGRLAVDRGMMSTRLRKQLTRSRR
jgi:thermitase